MKKIILMTLIAFSTTAFSANKNSNDSTVCYRVSMDCVGCKIKIEKNIAFEKGVKAMDINLEDKIVKIRFNSAKNNSQAIKHAIEALKYDVEIIRDCK